MLQITVHERTYQLASGASMTDTKQAVLDAIRTAPAFLSLRTAAGEPVEVSIAATTCVVLEEHEEPRPTIPRPDVIETDDMDLFDLGYF